MNVDLSAIRARLAAGEPRLVALIQGGRRWGLNAMHSLIAHAPADLAALCDEVEALTAEVERLRAADRRLRGLADNPYPDARNIRGIDILRALDGAE